VLVVALGGLGGCRDKSQVSPEPIQREPVRVNPAPKPVASVPPAEPVVKKAPKRPATSPVAGTRYFRATPNAANGWIELVISDRPTACGPHQEFPSTCEPAWRVRIDLAPEHQRPGEYVLGDELSPFSYRDAQGKSVGVWGGGVDCANLGGHFDGVLEITSIDSGGITGTLVGAGPADGPFRAERCPACRGTGMRCTSDAECCNGSCSGGTCPP
jgi:hypothetical protein